MPIHRSCLFFLCLLLFAAAGTGQIPSSADSTVQPEERIRLIVEEILEAEGWTSLDILLRQDPQVMNAMAVREGSLSYIKYNPDFIARFAGNPQAQYSAYALLAHEVGHHVRGHNLTEPDRTRRKTNELQADFFAGRILRVLCFEKEDAVAGFRIMLQDTPGSADYPPSEVREAAFLEGWIDRDAAIVKLGVDPCAEKPFDLNQAKSLPENLCQHPRAIIRGKKMFITYDLPKDERIPSYRVFFTIFPTAPLTPRSLDWVGDSTKPGEGRTLIWNFGDDGYTRAQVEGKSEWLGVAAYKPRCVPRYLSGGLRTVQIIGIAAGALTLGWGIYLKIDVVNKYKDYRNNRDPEADFWLKSELSREETFKQADCRNKWALGCMVVGAAAGGLSACWLYRRSKLNQRYKAADFYSSVDAPLRLERLTFGTDAGPGIGLWARF